MAQVTGLAPLVVIDNPAAWTTMKALAEEIGYCGIHAA